MSSGSGGRSALVTGGAGFIGSHLVDRLVAEGYQVRVLDDFSSGREENLQGSRNRVELVRGDVRDAELVGRAVDGVELVFHHAAIPSVTQSVSDPLGTHAVNVDGTLRVLDAALRAGVRRVVYAASSSAYGASEAVPKVETMPAAPISPYAIQKYVGELYCQQYAALYGLETVSLRYFNVFGPRQDPASEYAGVIPRFAAACLDAQPPRIYGDGKQTRDFIFVEDAVRANLLAADAAGAPGQVMNVATGRGTSLLELLDVIRELTGCQKEALHEAPREGDVRHSAADLALARSILGLEPTVELRDGLQRTIEDFARRRERTEG